MKVNDLLKLIPEETFRKIEQNPVLGRATRMIQPSATSLPIFKGSLGNGAGKEASACRQLQTITSIKERGKPAKLQE